MRWVSDADFYGSTGAIELNEGIAGMAPTPTGLGYWLVAFDGGIFAFGDADLMASAAAEQEYEDPVVKDPIFTDLSRRAGTKLYAVTIYWGMLEGDRDAAGSGTDGDLYDWSGGVQASDGAIVVRTLVSFEDDDHLLLPRPDRRTVEWVSHTGEGMDGIRLLVYQWPESELAGPDTLTLTTAMFSHSFPLEELAALDEIYDVDDVGNKVRIQAFLTDPTASVIHGFLRGRWVQIQEGETMGRFGGVWVGAHGRLSGYFRGHYGVNREGHQVFYGKYIDQTGRFVGFLRGRWQSEGVEINGAELGAFSGQWLNRERHRLGALRGHYRGREASEVGFLNGVWCAGCP